MSEAFTGREILVRNFFQDGISDGTIIFELGFQRLDHDRYAGLVAQLVQSEGCFPSDIYIFMIEIFFKIFRNIYVKMRGQA